VPFIKYVTGKGVRGVWTFVTLRVKRVGKKRQKLRGGRRGSKMVKICVTYFMNGPLVANYFTLALKILPGSWSYASSGLRQGVAAATRRDPMSIFNWIFLRLTGDSVINN
jgi:hypothetical protein